jgi:L-fuculose-phosphate aldolase
MCTGASPSLPGCNRRELIMELTTNETTMRHAVVEAYRELRRQGLNCGSTGNLSCRLDDKILITPTGAEGESIEEEMLVVIDCDGEILGPGTPSSEWHMHCEIYDRHPEAGAIAHTHSDACVALSCMRRPIPSFHYMVAGFGGNDIPCAAYAPFGSVELAHAAAEALSHHTACLLANHGMVCCGCTLESVVDAAVTLETLARQYLLTIQAGDPVLLNEEEMSVVRDRYISYSRLKDLCWFGSR